uniref:Glutamate decarboxylase n=1 Tax=Romanomermis culicivorax TaxID=13658 RepID=A0A915JTU2_ROMCU
MTTKETEQNFAKMNIGNNNKWSKVSDNVTLNDKILFSGHSLLNVYHTDILPTNIDGWKNTESFLLGVVKILFDYIKESNDRTSKLVRFHHPDQLAQILDLKISDDPRELKQLLDDCEQVLKYQVKTGHPHFFNQISTGLDLISMAGEWLTATANTNMFTYEISPVFILMEKEVMKEMIKMIGWPEGDGIFAPGGAISNLYAVNAARHHFYPRCKPLGMADIPKLAMFTSVDSHYSIKGAAAVGGIGTDNVFNIPVDKEHKMIPEALLTKIHNAKRQGYVPFFVNATAGTTVYGAFDPIEQIADICEANKIWLHVDAAWGGGLLLSPKHRRLLKGIERANSVTWNPHKLLGIHLQCSACLVRQDGLLFQCNQMSADYLFQQDKPYDVSYDTGDKAIQCGRHNDIFKFWLTWRAKGMNGYAKQINRLMDLAAYFTAKIKSTEGFEMVMDNPQFLNICFWYVPPSLRNLDPEEKKARLEKIAPKIKAKMMSEGTTMVGYQPDQNKPNFFRMVISNQAINKLDLDFLVTEIVRFGQDL